MNTRSHIFNTFKIDTVQLKGTLTHMDTAHATHWPKAHGYINLYWRVQ